MAISPYSSLRNPLLEESASHRAIENQKDMFNLLGGGKEKPALRMEETEIVPCLKGVRDN